MGVLAVLTEVVAVVAALLALTAAVVIGPASLREQWPRVPTRIRAAAGPLAILGGVLVLNRVVRDVGVELSWLIGATVTDTIYAIEGSLVASIQSLTTPLLTLYFGAIYVYGYTFLLVFPFVVGLWHPDPRHLRETVVAYALNYGVGVVCYMLFVAYGPRNYMPALVEPLLFDAIPRFQLLTSQVNANTNVFPSLHTSLSVTVALLARHTRDRYPRWFPIATFLALNVVVSTMLLGIHWATDVVAGAALAAGSVYVARRTALV